MYQDHNTTIISNMLHSNVDSKVVERTLYIGLKI